ncbi:Late embryogenesis abundant (LEA) hydroxyproline-rich glycoprotein family [Euphorbia peplus]|nr:Late embryogenesis abundant (LEA) hydroxyproline-rich glycoprotein family [Euphorbia peplus]
MSEKQQLNGAYYGPAIPPQRSYHRHRSSGCGCGCCLLSCLLKIIVSIVVTVGIAILIFWLVVRPNKVKFHVTEATLSEFNVDANNNLRYNLAMNITVRNPNKKIGIYYDYIEARAYYEDQRFAVDTLNPFYQGHKNTSVLSPVFRGQHLLVLSGDRLSDFNAEKTSGIYSIDVKVHFKIRFKIGDIKIGKFKPKVECDFKVPINGTNAFEATKCDWDY